ncbi:phosphate ABC transporter permease PstA [Sulfidibacter corallicola]
MIVEKRRTPRGHRKAAQESVSKTLRARLPAFPKRPKVRGGDFLLWLCAVTTGAVLVLYLMLLGVIAVNGLQSLWPKRVVTIEMEDGRRLIGQLQGHDTKHDRYRLYRANRVFQGDDFVWIEADQIETKDYHRDIVLVERRENGNLIGYLRAIQPGNLVSDEAALWQEVQKRRARVMAEEALAVTKLTKRMATINGRLEKLRLERRRYEDAGREPPDNLLQDETRLHETYLELDRRHLRLMASMRGQLVVLEDAAGIRHLVPFSQIVRAYRPNRLSTFDRLSIYGDKLVELFTEGPRESNTEGGLFPAILGTVMLVMLMSLFCVPLGVLAAVYLHEYASEGWLMTAIRLAVHNLAGVPGIVYGIFGLGFFVYGLGGSLDELFFAHKLPIPTFGTGGILWASLTMAILTVPVVIVSTEEGLRSVPRVVREGSMSLGATQFQTLVRVVLPMASPGILTGFILAIIRAAGEVAPLMIVGVVKMAPMLPVSDEFPFVHLERKFMHLGFHIYDAGFQSPNVEAALPMAYLTTTLLVFLVLCMSFAAMVLRARIRARYSELSL